jgi:hypothetical protein
MRRYRAILKIVCTTLLFIFFNELIAQPVKYFKVKDNTMYIVLSKELPAGAVDSFILKYDLTDIGLMRFMLKGIDDSLLLSGWKIDREKSDIFIITKPLDKADELITEDRSIFNAVPTPENWREQPKNKVVFGQNNFKNNYSFGKDKGIIYFELKDNSNFQQVKLAGNFTNWQHNAFPMTKTADGWIAKVRLKPGKYYYKFIINGRHWITDPQNNMTENDGRGNDNSVYFVTNKTLELKGYEEAQEVYAEGNFGNQEKTKVILDKCWGGWCKDIFLEPGPYNYDFIVDGKQLHNTSLNVGVNYTFVLKEENAKEVFVAGDFNNWNPKATPMQKSGNIWTCSMYLAPGKHRYKFIVDGHWKTDPKNKNWEENEFHTGNSIIWIDPKEPT